MKKRLKMAIAAAEMLYSRVEREREEEEEENNQWRRRRKGRRRMAKVGRQPVITGVGTGGDE